jgi:acetyl/propionyl-CoA carboxylase alpha subunit
MQLLVAMGERLPEPALSPTLTGHAIEVRLYAEDATNDFLPATGTLRDFALPGTVRLDSGFEPGSVVSPFYDAMLAKVIAHAPTRREAAATLGTALRGARIHGVTTNRDLLVRILAEEEFLAGDTDTAYLDRHPASMLGAPLLESDADRRRHAAVAAVALQAANRASATTWSRLPSGWRNNPSARQTVTLASGAEETVVQYAVQGSGTVLVDVDGEPVDFVLHGVDGNLVDATAGGVRFRSSAVIGPARDVVDVDSPFGSSSYTVVPRFFDPADELVAGSLVAPMPGAVVRVLVEMGAAVGKGDPLVVLEAMKMEHTIASPADGVVSEIRVQAGQQVDAGAVLAHVEAGEPVD